MCRTDCHQHLWPQPLTDLLRGRSTAPRLVGDVLHLDGEPPYDVDLGQHDLTERRARDLSDGIGRTLLSLSSPLGIESLPPEVSAPLLAAWHALTAGVTSHHRVWAAVNIVEPDLATLADVLAHPAVCGLQVPATALSTPAALERLAETLALVEAAELPVLVHPGPVAAGAADRRSEPDWWPALTAYPAQQAAAWFSWHVAGRQHLPRLRIAFVALAGLAPLHHERLAQRGGSMGAVDRHVYYETSSYGPRAIDAVVRVVGVDPLVHGSDRPYASPTDPGLGEAFTHALFESNPQHLLGGTR